MFGNRLRLVSLRVKQRMVSSLNFFFTIFDIVIKDLFTFQAYRLLIDLANFLMEQATGRVIIIGVPPRHDGTNLSIQELNYLLSLDKGFGYKYIGVAWSLSYETGLGDNKIHLEAENKCKFSQHYTFNSGSFPLSS